MNFVTKDKIEVKDKEGISGNLSYRPNDQSKLRFTKDQLQQLDEVRNPRPENAFPLDPILARKREYYGIPRDKMFESFAL